MTNEKKKKALDKAIVDYQREMFDKGGFYKSEMAQYLIQLSFEKCAEWKDQQFAVEKKALIDKACEWIKKENSFAVQEWLDEECANFETFMNNF